VVENCLQEQSRINDKGGVNCSQGVSFKQIGCTVARNPHVSVGRPKSFMK